MRPASKLTFGRLYLVATGLGLVNSIMAMDGFRQKVAAAPAIAKLGVSDSAIDIAIWGVMGFTVLLPLLLWFLVAHRASNVAKWVLLVWTVSTLYMLPSSLSQAGGLGVLVIVAIEALRIVAISFLFRADARAWLEGGKRDAQG